MARFWACWRLHPAPWASVTAVSRAALSPPSSPLPSPAARWQKSIAKGKERVAHIQRPPPPPTERQWPALGSLGLSASSGQRAQAQFECLPCSPGSLRLEPRATRQPRRRLFQQCLDPSSRNAGQTEMGSTPPVCSCEDNDPAEKLHGGARFAGRGRGAGAVAQRRAAVWP